ncbi:putative trafficking protein particle complex subunit [Piromyces finnis]|uniref:Trafficking protein particle complex subunit n=1 Tax=Piromyces finnis TaxID=1754191 RepID=A0A1Y1UT88_9FUNG|nr:putative trafficking protein particle complex subunit [Piromyces finnis]|eukprot:ORX40415.1 putative trafficking protein particle complex subunit [Piromyces finnis]
MIYNFYLFNRHCKCIYYANWQNDKEDEDNALSSKGNEMKWEEEAKLVYGVVYSLRNLCRKLSTVNGVPEKTDKDKEEDKENEDRGFLSYKTNAYKLHYYETASGLKFVVCTDPRSPNLQDMLHQIYRDIYVEYVVKNPLCMSDNDYINNELFKTKLHEFIKSQSN